MLILGIETSCDETALAVLGDDRVLSSKIASQIRVHAPYGGVVPEIAARHHLDALELTLRAALDEAGVSLADLQGIAVTRGPGLVGCLLVGVSFARSLASARGLPVVGVNHLEGHVVSGWLEKPDLPYPSLALIVSGGHTAIWAVPEPGVYRQYARTRDDAAGEAFDKAAKMLGLAYPGGPTIDKLAPKGHPTAFQFGEIRPKGGPAFSFSGYKTAVRTHMHKSGIEPLASPDDEPPQKMLDLIASFRRAVVRELLRQMRRAIEQEKPASLVLAGGVAANALLREKFTEMAREYELPLAIPAMRYCGDNAAMIALAGLRRLRAGENDLLDLDATANLPLGGPESERTSHRHR